MKLFETDTVMTFSVNKTSVHVFEPVAQPETLLVLSSDWAAISAWHLAAQSTVAQSRLWRRLSLSVSTEPEAVKFRGEDAMTMEECLAQLVKSCLLPKHGTIRKTCQEALGKLVSFYLLPLLMSWLMSWVSVSTHSTWHAEYYALFCFVWRGVRGYLKILVVVIAKF